MMSGTCESCCFWTVTHSIDGKPFEGNCSSISQKVTADIQYGWDGGYIIGYETEADFGCNLFEVREEMKD